MCDHLEELSRMEVETLDMFYVILLLNLMQFWSKYFPPQLQLIGWFRHLVSLSCDNCQELESITFIGNSTLAQNDNFNSS